MKLDELQTRLTHLLTALSNEDSRIIQGFTKAFIEDFTPNQTWVISLTEIEGYDKPLIEYTTWDEEKDGPIPGIKLFKHLNIFLEREYANTNLIILITMETNFEYLIQILRDPSLDTWTLEEQQEINNLDLSQGLHTFLYDAYTGIITYQPNKLKQVSSDIIYQSDHIIILDSDSTIYLD
jgi:hypothetical protein